MSRLALLATAVSLTLVATPVLAQSSNGSDNKAAAVTQGSAPNNGLPSIGAMLGAMTAPFTGQPSSGCSLHRDFNGRYTSVCGPNKA